MSVDEEYLQKVMRTLSHDLGSALRASAGFSTLLVDKYSDTLDEKALHWLSLIRSEGELAQEKLKALSRYARLYGVDSNRSNCVLVELCERVIREDVSAKYPSFSVEIAELPVIDGYDFLWMEFFREAIKNCAQHSGNDSCRIYHEQTDSGLAIIVEDAGCGVPSARLENIMLPLRSLSEEGGLGIGLSVIKRIVELHGGTLTLATEFLPRKEGGEQGEGQAGEQGGEQGGFRVAAELPLRVLEP